MSFSESEPATVSRTFSADGLSGSKKNVSGSQTDTAMTCNRCHSKVISLSPPVCFLVHKKLHTHTDRNTQRRAGNDTKLGKHIPREPRMFAGTEKKDLMSLKGNTNTRIQYSLDVFHCFGSVFQHSGCETMRFKAVHFLNG